MSRSKLNPKSEDIFQATIPLRDLEKIGPKHVTNLELSKGGDNESILYFFVRNKRYDVVLWLLDNGCDVHSGMRTEYEGFSPLNEAASLGDAKMTRLLLEKGHSVTRGYDGYDYGTTPIEATNDLEVVSILFEYGARSPRGFLCKMVGKGSIRGVQMALKSGASANDSIDSQEMGHYVYEQKFALFIAAKNGNEEIVKYLLESGADVERGHVMNYYTCFDYRPIDSTLDVKVWKMLKFFGAIPQKKTTTGKLAKMTMAFDPSMNWNDLKRHYTKEFLNFLLFLLLCFDESDSIFYDISSDVVKACIFPYVNEMWIVFRTSLGKIKASLGKIKEPKIKRKEKKQ